MLRNRNRNNRGYLYPLLRTGVTQGYDMNKEKAQGLLRLRLNGILSPFNLYGMSVYFPQVVNEIVEAAEEYCKNKSDGGDNENTR